MAPQKNQKKKEKKEYKKGYRSRVLEWHWGWLTAALIEAICLSYKLKYLHFILEMLMLFLRDPLPRSGNSIWANNAKQIGYSNPQTPHEELDWKRAGVLLGLQFMRLAPGTLNAFCNFHGLPGLFPATAENSGRSCSSCFCGNKKAIKITFYGPRFKAFLGLKGVGCAALVGSGEAVAMTGLMQPTDGAKADEILPPGTPANTHVASTKGRKCTEKKVVGLG